MHQGSCEMNDHAGITYCWCVKPCCLATVWRAWRFVRVCVCNLCELHGDPLVQVGLSVR